MPTPGCGKKVVVAMSGGVDSSVAAALLLEQGYDVIGAFLRLGSPEGVDTPTTCAPAGSRKQGCCSVNDAADARRVAGVLGVPLYVLNFQDEFARVIDYFADEYARGRTPNPCVRCNDWLKFGRLERYAQAVGAAYVASGHYARILADAAGRPRLARGVDARKDQSYVLFGVTPDALARTLLPVGAFEKPEIRRRAAELGLSVADKPDSQEICFVPDGDYAAMIERRRPGSLRNGELVDTGGHVVGRHEGHQRFTIGQRRGVGVAFGRPIYVVGVDPQANRVVVGDPADLLCTSLVARQVNVHDPTFLVGDWRRGEVKVRSNGRAAPAIVQRTADDELRVTFDDPQSAVAPGQAAVCYEAQLVLAGGWIERVD